MSVETDSVYFLKRQSELNIAQKESNQIYTILISIFGIIGIFISGTYILFGNINEIIILILIISISLLIVGISEYYILEKSLSDLKLGIKQLVYKINQNDLLNNNPSNDIKVIENSNGKLELIESTQREQELEIIINNTKDEIDRLENIIKKLSEEIESQKVRKQSVEQAISKIIKNSTSINIKIFIETIQRLAQCKFNFEDLFDYSEKFHYHIDGDFVIFRNETNMNALDKAFSDWDNTKKESI